MRIVWVRHQVHLGYNCYAPKTLSICAAHILVLELFFIAAYNFADSQGVNMTKAIKATLLSAFVFPGLGQCYLKRFKRGILIIVLTLAGLSALIVRTLLSALDTLDALQKTGKPIDANAISGIAESASSFSSGNTALLIFLIACWAYAIVDAYLFGKKENQIIDSDAGSHPD